MVDVVADPDRLTAVGAPTSMVLFVLGVLLVAITWGNVIRVLIIARPTRAFLTSATTRLFVWPTKMITRHVRDYERRDRILTWQAPLQIVAMAVVWLATFLLGYALMLSGDGDLGIAGALRESGSSLFTLGFASGDRGRLTTIDFIAAANGPMLIGLLIGYLPTMYAAYNTRELQVTRMHARAGEPNWGPELLSRAALTDSLDQLPSMWIAWEGWAADVSESHSSYPILIQTRSARPTRSWWVALLSVMDAAALNLSLRPGDRQGAARMLLRQGVECMADLAAAARVKVPHPDENPSPQLRLTFEEFAEAVDHMELAGYVTERRARDAWPHFCRWRSRYEAVAYTMAEHLDAVPAPWSGPRRPATSVMWPDRSAFYTSDEA